MPTRAQAEDLAGEVQIELDELPAVVDVVAAMRSDSPRVFDEWPSNAYISTTVTEGDPQQLAAAPIRLHRRLRLNRQATVSMEGRGVLAYWDRRLDELVVYLSTQGGQVKRLALSRMLGVPEHKVRVIAPDVGGGFGGKNRIMPEDVAIAALAMKVGHPVRWIEDRREHLLASPHARDHTYDLTICAERDGTLLGIEGDIYIDAGAYALVAHGCFSGSEHGVSQPDRAVSHAPSEAQCPHGRDQQGTYGPVPRRGAAGRYLRARAPRRRSCARTWPRAFRLAPAEHRHQRGASLQDRGRHEARHRRLRGFAEIARDKIDFVAIRQRQAKGEPDGRRIGVGFAFYTEQSGHGIVEFAKRKFRVIPGYESAIARMLPDGSVIIYVGVQNHGQGHETTLAQIAAHELGIDPGQISVRYGDTAVGPYGFGTFASRSIVFAGGAVGKASRALAEKIKRIGAHLLQADVAATRIEGGMVHGPSSKVGIAEIAFAANARPDHLPAGMEPLLDSTATYEPADFGGVFAYGTHAVVVAVDPDSGMTELLDYVVSEDCGTMINPMIVDGQVLGGIVQGIGTALYEEIPYDDRGQPLVATLADYLVPCVMEFLNVRIEHLVTPALTTEYGVKGLGEGGAIAPPAAIANAVADAFADIRANFNETPLSPRRVYETVARTLAKAAKA